MMPDRVGELHSLVGDGVRPLGHKLSQPVWQSAEPACLVRCGASVLGQARSQRAWSCMGSVRLVRYGTRAFGQVRTQRACSGAQPTRRAMRDSSGFP